MADKEKDLHAGHRKRMLQKYRKNGADIFEGHEMLEMLMYFSIPRINTNGTAHNVINTRDGLYNALYSEQRELIKAEGVGTHTATLIRIASDTVRCAELDHCAQVPLDNAFKQSRYIFNWYKGKPGGTVIILLLDKNKKLIDTVCLSFGRKARTSSYPDSVVQAAVDNEAKYVILAHNHKSNIEEPSVNDLYLTSCIRLALADKKIILLEHYIITDYDCIPTTKSI